MIRKWINIEEVEELEKIGSSGNFLKMIRKVTPHHKVVPLLHLTIDREETAMSQ